MLQICYSSQAVRPFDAHHLARLLARARVNNQRVGVGGLLLYEDQCFIQVLEGDARKVMRLFERIQLDPRHNHMRLIFRQEIESPSFPEWSMGFFHVDRHSVEDLPGYNNFFTKEFSVAAFRQDEQRVREIFLQFRQGLWHSTVKC